MRNAVTPKRDLICSAAAMLTLCWAFAPAYANDGGNGDGVDRVVAVADIFDCRDGEYRGRAVLVEKPSDQGVKTVEVKIKVEGLEPGAHAVHIHEEGECEPCGAAGGHFDPGPAGLSSPDGNHPFHSGDLVNIDVKDNGKGSLKTLTTRISLSEGPLSVFDDDGSSIVIHDMQDTFCPNGAEAGCAGGSRAACGVIEPM